MDIDIDKIQIGARKRGVNKTKVIELANSIKQVGLLNPITVCANNEHYNLIAGLHRLEACKSLEWKKITANLFEGDSLDAELAEIDENLLRNELTVLEQGEYLQRRNEILEEKKKRAKRGGQIGNKNASKNESDTMTLSFQTTAAIANELGLSERSAQRRIQAANNIIPEVKEVIRNTDIADSTTQLLELARMDAKTQQAIANLINEGKAETIKEAKSEITRQDRVERITEISTGNKELKTDKTYPVIYADPPWQYEHTKTENRAIENQYPTMTLEDICKLPVSTIASKDCVLFLWATSPKLAEAMRVIESWGFVYRTCMVWLKDKIGMGYYARQKHELLLIATKGELPVPKPENRPESVIFAPRTEHSKKPVEFYDIIEKMYPEYARIELFSRSAKEGWDTWGNQV